MEAQAVPQNDSVIGLLRQRAESLQRIVEHARNSMEDAKADFHRVSGQLKEVQEAIAAIEAMPPMPSRILAQEPEQKQERSAP